MKDIANKLPKESMFYLKNLECELCNKKFQSYRVKNSKIRRRTVDPDFRVVFVGINPNIYLPCVCPHCGYAFTDSFSPFRQDGKDKVLIEEKVSKNWNYKDYGTERSIDEGIQAFKLALLCGTLKKEKGHVMAGLLHHVAWLYRELENKEEEKRFLKMALEQYRKVYEESTQEINEAKLLYLMGELNLLLGDINQAGRWLQRVINDKNIMDASIIRMARDRWQDLRSEMEQKK